MQLTKLRLFKHLVNLSAVFFNKYNLNVTKTIVPTYYILVYCKIKMKFNVKVKIKAFREIIVVDFFPFLVLFETYVLNAQDIISSSQNYVSFYCQYSPILIYDMKLFFIRATVEIICRLFLIINVIYLIKYSIFVIHY